MSGFLSNDEIIKIKEEINLEYKKIYEIEKYIKQIKETIENKKEYLLNNCQHNKKIDRIVFSEHTEFYCDKCGLSL
jgi:hypothetical protein